jgi:hypothetical protein
VYPDFHLSNIQIREKKKVSEPPLTGPEHRETVLMPRFVSPPFLAFLSTTSTSPTLLLLTTIYFPPTMLLPTLSLLFSAASLASSALASPLIARDNEHKNPTHGHQQPKNGGQSKVSFVLVGDSTTNNVSFPSSSSSLPPLPRLFLLASLAEWELLTCFLRALEQGTTLNSGGWSRGFCGSLEEGTFCSNRSVPRPVLRVYLGAERRLHIPIMLTWVLVFAELPTDERPARSSRPVSSSSGPAQILRCALGTM